MYLYSVWHDGALKCKVLKKLNFLICFYDCVKFKVIGAKQIIVKKSHGFQYCVNY